MKTNIYFPCKILFLAFIICVFSWQPQSASSKDFTVKTIPNVRLQNHTNHVSNPDRILTQSDVDRINELLNKLENSTSIEVAVVAVHSIGYNDARSFATELFNHWGIGKKEDDNGLLIQLVTEPVQRSVVFEVGYGLEGVLPDILCFQIQQNHMIGDLKSGNYSAGMVKGVEAVVDYLLASDYERVAMYPPSALQTQNTGKENRGVIILLLAVSLILILLVIVAYIKSRKTHQCPECKNYRCYKVKEIKRFTTKVMNVRHTIYLCNICGYTKTEEYTYPISHTIYSSCDEPDPHYRRSSSHHRSSYSGRSSGSRSSSGSSSSSGSRSSSGSSGSSRSRGSSYGGGRSGGGGSISRF